MAQCRDVVVETALLADKVKVGFWLPLLDPLLVDDLQTDGLGFDSSILQRGADNVIVL